MQLGLTSQFYFCPNFLVFDSYQGCVHGCKYCFAQINYLSNASTLKMDFKAIKVNWLVDNLDSLVGLVLFWNIGD